MKTLNLKKKFMITLILTLLTIIIMYNINNYYQEKAFINHCIEFCFTDIYNYMTQEDSKNYFGSYNVRFGTETKPLLTIFYNDFIINKQYIITYLNNLNWDKIIINNKGNINAIITDIRQQYIMYIREEENNFTRQLLENTNLDNIKETLVNLLQIYGKNLDLNPLQKAIATCNAFITNVIEDINWNLYIRTAEFQNKDYLTLFEIFQNKVQEVNISRDIYLLTLKEFLICDSFKFLLLFVCLSTPIIITCLINTIFINYVNTKAVLIVGSVLFNEIDDLDMTNLEFQDLCLALARLLIEKETFIKILTY